MNVKHLIAPIFLVAVFQFANVANAQPEQDVPQGPVMTLTSISVTNNCTKLCISGTATGVNFVCGKLTFPDGTTMGTSATAVVNGKWKICITRGSGSWPAGNYVYQVGACPNAAPGAKAPFSLSANCKITLGTPVPVQ